MDPISIVLCLQIIRFSSVRKYHIRFAVLCGTAREVEIIAASVLHSIPVWIRTLRVPGSHLRLENCAYVHAAGAHPGIAG